MADPTPPRSLPARSHRADAGANMAPLAGDVCTRRRHPHSLPRHRMHNQALPDQVPPRKQGHHTRRSAWGCHARCWRWCCRSRSRRRQQSERRWVRGRDCHPAASSPQTAAGRSARHAYRPAAAGGQRTARPCGNHRETRLAPAGRGGQTRATSAHPRMRLEVGKRSRRRSRPLRLRSLAPLALATCRRRRQGFDHPSPHRLRNQRREPLARSCAAAQPSERRVRSRCAHCVRSGQQLTPTLLIRAVQTLGYQRRHQRLSAGVEVGPTGRTAHRAAPPAPAARPQRYAYHGSQRPRTPCRSRHRRQASQSRRMKWRGQEQHPGRLFLLRRDTGARRRPAGGCSARRRPQRRCSTGWRRPHGVPQQHRLLIERPRAHWRRSRRSQRPPSVARRHVGAGRAPCGPRAPRTWSASGGPPHGVSGTDRLRHGDAGQRAAVSSPSGRRAHQQNRRGRRQRRRGARAAVRQSRARRRRRHRRGDDVGRQLQQAPNAPHVRSRRHSCRRFAGPFGDHCSLIRSAAQSARHLARCGAADPRPARAEPGGQHWWQRAPGRTFPGDFSAPAHPGSRCCSAHTCAPSGKAGATPSSAGVMLCRHRQLRGRNR